MTCSYPGWEREVEQIQLARVKARNRHGKEIRVKSSGFTARAFQHELDHLDGVLFTDKLTSLDRLRRGGEMGGGGGGEGRAPAPGLATLLKIVFCRTGAVPLASPPGVNEAGRQLVVVVT